MASIKGGEPVVGYPKHRMSVSNLSDFCNDRERVTISFFSTIPILSIRPCMTVLQNHLINNLPAQDTSPSHKVLIGPVESFIDHHTPTTMTLHLKLLRIGFPPLPKSAICKI
jgi:hypothetical protein